MSHELPMELKLALSSFFLGNFLMVIYEGIRLLRRIFRHSKWTIGLEDFNYWILSALLTFSLLYRQNNGVLRWYAVTGVFLGMLFFDRFIDSICGKLLKIYRKCHRMKI